ncbi:carbohydrate ABC transporter permease [Spelaeicoccus albus]|nr:sugar ABC transporter permease [Spelaeicoccus albus]
MRRRFGRKHAREYLTFVAFVLPNIALIAVFIYRPLISNIYYSMLDWRLGSATAKIVGLANYVNWFTDPGSLEVIRITVIFTIATVGGSMVIGLALALALNQRIPGTAFARSAVFAPYVLSGVGVGMVWLFIFDPTYGALSGILRLLGTSGPDWYLDRNWALVMLIIVYVWKNLGYAAVIYLAGLQSVPNDLLEAAQIDGAGGSKRFFKIVLPLLSPTTFFLLVTIVLNSLQSFDLIRIMTKGGPLDGTKTLIYQVYEEAFVNGRAGYSSTVAIILFVVLLLLTVGQMRYLERRVHYS